TAGPIRTSSVPDGPEWAGAWVTWACSVGGSSAWAGADGGAGDVVLAAAGWAIRPCPQATSWPAAAHGVASARRAETVSHTSPPAATVSGSGGSPRCTWSPGPVTGTSSDPVSSTCPSWLTCQEKSQCAVLYK